MLLATAGIQALLPPRPKLPARRIASRCSRARRMSSRRRPVVHPLQFSRREAQAGQMSRLLTTLPTLRRQAIRLARTGTSSQLVSRPIPHGVAALPQPQLEPRSAATVGRMVPQMQLQAPAKRMVMASIRSRVVIAVVAEVAVTVSFVAEAGVVEASEVVMESLEAVVAVGSEDEVREGSIVDAVEDVDVAREAAVEKVKLAATRGSRGLRLSSAPTQFTALGSIPWPEEGRTLGARD